MPKKLVVTCLVNFFIAAFLGLVLRYVYINPLAINYRFLTHAHSHVAMLGWVYLMLYTILVYYFVPEQKPIYSKLFWITEIAVLGMLCSFPFQGYAAVSISFSTLHILCSYYFVFLLWKDLKIKNVLVMQLVKIALVFMLLSTVGVWCLGPAVGLMGKATAFYQIAIQFFLHFQFNGWFLFAVIALFFWQLNIKSSSNSRLFLQLFVTTTILTLALPVQWFLNHPTLYYINVLGIILQLVVLVIFLKIIKTKFLLFISNQPTHIKLLYYFALFCFILKIVVQTISIVPEFSSEVYQYRDFVIGFIHLLMLGVISGFLFAFLLKLKILMSSLLLKLGLYSFITGFVVTEGILLVQGYLFYLKEGLLSNYYVLLFSTSVLLPLGILFILLSFLKTKKL